MTNSNEPDTPLERHDPSDEPACTRNLVNAIDQYLKHHRLPDPNVVLTDVMIVATHRGFSNEGTTTATSMVCPTESSIATLLGLTQYASIFYGNMAARSMQAGTQ